MARVKNQKGADEINDKKNPDEAVECLLLRKDWWWRGKRTGEKVMAPRGYAEGLEEAGWLKILGDDDE